MKKEIRGKVYKKFDGHCAYCGEEIEYKKMQVDHMKPKLHTWSNSEIDRHNRNVQNLIDRNVKTKARIIVRGSDDIENLFPACRRCNYHKSSLTIEGFREVIKHKIEVLNRDSTPYRIAKDYGLIQETDSPVIFYFEECQQ